MQVDSVKPKLKPPGTKCLTLKCDILLSSFTFKLNLRRYTKSVPDQHQNFGCSSRRNYEVGKCRLTQDDPGLTAPGVSA